MPARSASSPGKVTAQESTSPLAGSAVFLHISTGPGAKPSVASIRRECRQRVEQLGGSLTLSEAGASLVVGVNASPGFIDGCAARGKAVVSPAYLQACAKAGRRVDVRDHPAAAVSSAAEPPSHAPNPLPASKDLPPAWYGGARSSHVAFSILSATTKPKRGCGKRSHAATRRLPSAPAHAATGIQLLMDGDSEDSIGDCGEIDNETKGGSSMTSARGRDDAPTWMREVSEEQVYSSAPGPLSSTYRIAMHEAEEISSSGSVETVAVTPPRSLEINTSHALVRTPTHEPDEIRHAILRSTGKQRTTAALGLGLDGQRGTPMKLRPIGKAHQAAEDPFLSRDSTTGTTTEGTAAPLPPSPTASPPLDTASAATTATQGAGEKASLSTHSSLPSCSVTQPLPGSSPPQPFASAVSKGANAAKAAVKAMTSNAKKPTLTKAVTKGKKAASTSARTARAIAAVKAPPHAPEAASPPLLPMHFTDHSQLHRTDAHPAKDYCIALLVRDNTQASFLADIIEQLGARCVPAEQIFGRHRKPTHLVVDDLCTDKGSGDHSTGDGHSSGNGGSEERGGLAADAQAERVGLTPAILLAKALGLRIARPQWLYDAIFLGGFPEFIPNVHTHPIFGVEQNSVNEPPAAHADADDLSRQSRFAFCKRATGAEALAAAVARAREEREREETAQEVLGVALSPLPLSATAGDVKDAATPQAEPQRQAAAGAAAKPTLSRSGSGRSQQAGGGATLAFLTKTTRDEVMPPGQIWERPYYRPVFAGMAFFLEIGSRGHARKVIATSNPCSHRNNSNGKKLPHQAHSLLSNDEVEAFEQATELIRALGGTVARTRDSPHLDIILDIYGFSPPAGSTLQEEDHNHDGGEAVGSGARDNGGCQRHGSRKRGRHASMTSLPSSLVVMESASSLSHAYQEALVRLETHSQQYHPLASPLAMDLGDAMGPVGEQRKKPEQYRGGSDDGRNQDPPTVGVPWLVHSVLQRACSHVTPFLLASDGSRTPEKLTPTTAARDGKLASVARLKSPTELPSKQAGKATAAPGVADAANADPFLLLHHAMNPMVKTRVGPATARKQAEQQLETQELRAVLRSVEDT